MTSPRMDTFTKFVIGGTSALMVAGIGGLFILVFGMRADITTNTVSLAHLTSDVADMRKDLSAINAGLFTVHDWRDAAGRVYDQMNETRDTATIRFHELDLRIDELEEWKAIREASGQ